MIRPAVILFDVDGTLVSAGRAGRRAIARALEEALGPLDGVVAGLRLDGKTDRLIVREVFDAIGRPFLESACDEILRRYLSHLAQELETRPDPNFKVLPGVRALLHAIAKTPTRYGLCTGNVVEGARIKLARGNLADFFDFTSGGISGFGEDGEARERVVEAALGRARSLLGNDLSPRDVLVVGDTPRDVESAHRVGCPVLAVATGRYGVEELRATGSEGVVPTLLHPDALSWLLGPDGHLGAEP